MNRRLKTTYFLSLAAAGALTLGACSTTASDQPVDIVTVTPTEGPTITDYWPETTPEPTPTSAPPASLGDVHTYDNGLQVSVVYVGQGFSEYSQQAYSNYDVIVWNGTSETYDPSAVSLTVNYGAAGTPASQVFDLSVNPNPYFQGVILPGGMQTVRQSYTVPEGEPVVVTVTPDWDTETVVFTG